MGFMTGFVGGFTLTASVLYISAQVHRSTRLAQRDAIREQVEILNDLSSPLGAYYRRFASDDESHGLPIAPQARKPSAEELLKQQWNSEVKALARKTQNLRWQDVTNTVTDIGRMVWDLTKRQ